MGILTNIFKKKTSTKKDNGINHLECKKLIELNSFINNLLSENRYIAKSEFQEIILDENKTIEYFHVLEKSNMLNEFCKKNNISTQFVEKILEQYEKIEELFDEHNNSFIQKTMIEEKEYLDNILKNVDPNIVLDDDQRKVVLTDEDYCLVIAGAGAGKTTTVAAKVKYLVEKKNIDPSQILVVSFTNKAVQELRDKLNRDLKIDCPIATFHSTGNAIIRKQNPEKLNIVESSKLYYVIQDYFKKSILMNESLVNNLILFFASYFDAPFEGDDLNAFFNKVVKTNYSTLKSELENYQQQIIDNRSKKTVTIQSEIVRSFQEVEIANFLYLNNIEYEYEPIYKYDILYARKPYTPDFIIRQDDKIAYIEHFGITQEGKNNRYSEDELTFYKKSVNHKINLHRQHGTTLIYTFSEYNDQRSLIDHLKEELIKNGFELRPRSNVEVMEKLVNSEENRYIRKLVSLLCRFISNFKTNGYIEDDFNRMYHSTKNVRSRLFLDICHDCYLEYQRYLQENNAVDFEDLINESAKILREIKEMKQKLDFKYIIVDEYQDISRQRFDLVKALSEVCDAKIIAVGDDWQSIYAFSGSDIQLFTKFADKMGYAKLLKIVKTYRNSQEVIDIAGNFIQQNKSQISKELLSPKHICDPVVIYTYDGSPKKANATNKTGANYELAHAVEVALEQIMEYNKQENKSLDSSILLLGRFGFDGDKLEKSGLFEFDSKSRSLKSVKYPKLNITFMTAHASKGLGYDNVIIINGKNETYGFPSKIEDDPVLSFVLKGDRSIDYAEERRLFYVAMTRTKNRVFVVAPEANPSEFLLEIKKNYKNVVLKGTWNEEPPKKYIGKKICPICGYPIQFRYKNAYGLRLFMCTNEPELCGFMTNEYKAGKLSIMKCDRCQDGYMIVKSSKDRGYFLGCTNYKINGKGCNNKISKHQFYILNHYSPDLILNENIVVKEEKSQKESTVSSLQKNTVIKTESIEFETNIKEVFYFKQNLYDVIVIILNALLHVSEINYYGITTLTDVLRGSKKTKLKDNQLNQIPEYGKLNMLNREDIIFIIEWLIDNKFILKTKHPTYPVLHPTYKGIHLNENISDKLIKNLYIKLNKS